MSKARVCWWNRELLSFRCAEIYEDPIGQPDRAVRHYERVLSVDEQNERAARALAHRRALAPLV